MPEISVIIPTYNRRDFILHALQSVLCQNVGSIETIIVDDGSTDDTRKALLPHTKDIRYFYQDNRGVASARNRGVRESKGTIITFLDSDDLWIPGTLEARLRQPLSEDLLSFRGVEWFTDSENDRALLSKVSKVQWPRCDSDDYLTDPVLDVAEGRYLHLGTLLCRKTAFLRVGLFDETLCLGEDEDWFSRASLFMRFRYSSDPVLRIRLHRKQTDFEREECIRSLITVFSNIKSRTSGRHRIAASFANHRLAAKWSQLANCLSKQGRRIEAARAALNAYGFKPFRLMRLAKAFLILAGYQSGR